MADHNRRTVLKGIAGASAAAVVGASTAGTDVVAAQSGDWSAPPGIEREFTFDTGDRTPLRVGYNDFDSDSESYFEVTGTAETDGGNTGAWLAEFDNQGNENYSTTVYDPAPGYPKWEAPSLESSGPDTGKLVLGFAENGSGERQAMYGANIVKDTDVQWTTTFAGDVEWGERRRGLFGSISFFSDFTDPPRLKVASGGESGDPLVHDDWVDPSDGTVTRNLVVNDDSIERVDSVTHDFDKPWVYLFGTTTGGGAFAQAASPDDQEEWRTDLSEFADEEFLAGDYSNTRDGPPAYVAAADAAGTGDWIKRLDSGGSVVNSRTYSPPSGGDAATRFPLRFFGGFWMIGPTGSGSWVRSVADDLSVNWTTTVDGEARAVQRLGTFRTLEGHLVLGRRDGAPTFWRLSTAGDVQWSTSLGNDDTDFLNTANLDSVDGFVLTGRTGSMGDGDGNPWVARLNADGTVAWQEVYGGAEWDRPNPSSVDDQSGFLFADSGSPTVDVLELSTAVDREDGDGGGGPLARFDTSGDGRIGATEALNAIAAYNSGGQIGGEPVTATDVLDVIAAYNAGTEI